MLMTHLKGGGYERKDGANRTKYKLPVYSSVPAHDQSQVEKGVYHLAFPIKYSWYMATDPSPKAEPGDLDQLTFLKGQNPSHLHVEELATAIICDKILLDVHGCLPANSEEAVLHKLSNTNWNIVKPLKWRKRSRNEHDGGIILSTHSHADINMVTEWCSARLGQGAFIDLVLPCTRIASATPTSTPAFSRRGL